MSTFEKVDAKLNNLLAVVLVYSWNFFTVPYF